MTVYFEFDDIILALFFLIKLERSSVNFIILCKPIWIKESCCCVFSRSNFLASKWTSLKPGFPLFRRSPTKNKFTSIEYRAKFSSGCRSMAILEDRQLSKFTYKVKYLKQAEKFKWDVMPSFTARQYLWTTNTRSPKGFNSMNFYCLLKVFHFIGKFAQLLILPAYWIM